MVKWQKSKWQKLQMLLRQKENQINYSSKQSCFRCGEKHRKGRILYVKQIEERAINVTRRVI